jgi:hypothetical protein
VIRPRTPRLTPVGPEIKPINCAEGACFCAGCNLLRSGEPREGQRSYCWRAGGVPSGGLTAKSGFKPPCAERPGWAERSSGKANPGGICRSAGKTPRSSNASKRSGSAAKPGTLVAAGGQDAVLPTQWPAIVVANWRRSGKNAQGVQNHAGSNDRGGGDCGYHTAS